MPRQKRLIINNACYHIITKGNQQQNVFKEPGDFETYLELLSKYKRQYKFKLYGWCLMNNHIHMVIESDNLSKVMHCINLSYAQYFNFQYHSTGHFWQDRFKSFVIEKDEYIFNCITYIEYNPVRAKIVSRPEDYRWSSYNARILGKNDGLLDFIIL